MGGGRRAFTHPSLAQSELTKANAVTRNYVVGGGTVSVSVGMVLHMAPRMGLAGARFHVWQ